MSGEPICETHPSLSARAPAASVGLTQVVAVTGGRLLLAELAAGVGVLPLPRVRATTTTTAITITSPAAMPIRTLPRLPFFRPLPDGIVTPSPDAAEKRS